MNDITLTPIGAVESPLATQTDLGWGSVISRVVLLPEYRAGLQGLDAFSHVIVVIHLHRARFDPGRDLVRRPRGLAEMPEVGIFAQRARDRPNAIGVTAVEIVEVRADSVVVRGLDAIDGTPVVDLKPYVPQYDRIESPTTPGWMNRLMEGYFRDEEGTDER
jgi:tRNA-Thr(GGU) m(6)t(6)A37 methyltransferase TsaA